MPRVIFIKPPILEMAMSLFWQYKLIKYICLSRIYGFPYKLNFAVTSQCNSRCKTCNTWKIKKDISKELSFDEISRIFQNFPKTVSWMSFTGGEPFLRNDFADILKLAVKRLNFMTISSNGLLRNRIMDILENLPDFPMVINFSIDGPNDVHNSIRGVKNAFEKTWKTYTETLELSKKKKNLKVGFETTVSTFNLPQLKDFLMEKMIEGHKPILTFAQEGNLYTNFGMKQISPKRCLTEVEELIRLQKQNLKLLNPVHYVERSFLNKVIPFLKGKVKQPYRCVAGSMALALNPFGEVFPCLIWNKPLGNLRQNEYNLKRILKQNSVREARRLIKTEQCPNCWTPCEAYQSIITSMLKINF